MSLIRTTRRSGRTLIVLGLIGAAFFWLTDPRLGPAVSGPRRSAYDPRAWAAALRGGGPGVNPIDAADDALVATAVGLLGSACVLSVGVYLTSRRKL